MTSARGKRAASIKEVAAAAGVSTATASRALTGSKYVSESLVEAVLAAADALGYQPNASARALRTRRSPVLGMVVPDLQNPFFPAIVKAVESAARARGRALLLADCDDSIAEEARAVTALLAHDVDGLIISPVDRRASAPAVQAASKRIAVVQVDRRAVARLPWVGVDQRGAVSAIIDHLASEGARSLTYVSGDMRSSTAADREQAFRECARAAGVRGHVIAGGFAIEDGRKAGRTILSSGRVPDAVVCANDMTAIGVIKEFSQARVAVPDYVLVTGFDDTLLAAQVQPALTSVRQPLGDLGARSVEKLLDPAAEGPDVLAGELLVRDSSLRVKPTGLAAVGSVSAKMRAKR